MRYKKKLTILSLQVLIFPSHNSVHVDGIFDAHVRLQKPEEVELPKGINRGTLLKYRLNEVVDEQNGDTQSDKRRDFQYSLDNLPIKRAVFIDSTWNQCRSIYKDDRINKLRPVVLQNRLSQFWRHQKKRCVLMHFLSPVHFSQICFIFSPRWFLATIEGIKLFKMIWNLLWHSKLTGKIFDFFKNSNSSISAGSSYQRVRSR